MALERHAGRLWTSSAGGPLLVLESHRLNDWGGLDNGDYDRACATTATVEAIAVGDGAGLILGDEPALTAAAERADGLVFVRWGAADDAESVEQAILALQHAPAVDAVDSGLVFHCTGTEIVIFDAVEPGVEQTRYALPADKDLGDGATRIALAPGRYSVRLGELDPRVGSLSVVQLLRVPPARS